MKLWAGRFTENTNEDADGFNSSLSFDKRLYCCDINGSVAHTKMLGKCGIISAKEAETICNALKSILDDINENKIAIIGAEDIHSFVENELVKRIGNTGKKVHTGRSRNDQVALDMRLYLRDSAGEVISLIKSLISVLLQTSKENLSTVMPAFTHLQKAQPTTLAHHLTAYCEMFLRDIDRFEDAKRRINVLPLGSGACTSTTYPIDREYTAKLLDFDSVSGNSMDAVSDRDFVLDYLYASAVFMMHLSRMAEEYIMWASDEYKFIEISDKFSTGSSIMPQKKNPDMFELIRGKCGRSYGNLMCMLTVMKALPLAYDKDMQEDKEAFFDTEATIMSCLKITIAMLEDISYNKDKMRASTDGGFTSATECADYLVGKGIPFRDAHSIIGGLVVYCINNKKTLQTLSIDEYRSFSDFFASDIFDVIQAENAIEKRQATGGPSTKAMLKEIEKIEKSIK